MRRPAKIAAWTLLGLTVAIVLLIAAVFILGNTDAGRGTIEKLTYRLTGGTVKISGLGGSFPRHLIVAELELKDDRGVWLTARRIALDWTPLAYLEGRLQIDQLHADDVNMQRLPHSSSPSSAEPSIPRIDVAAASIDLVELGPELAGAPASLVARGSFHLRSARDMSIDATAQRIGDEGDYALHLRFDPKRMDADLKLHEPADGPLENILGVPGLGALSATLTLSGPRSAEQIAMTLQAGSLTGSAQGRFNLTDVSADVEFAFDSSAMNPRADVSWERATLMGRWTGSLLAPTASGHLEATRLRLPGGVSMAELKAELSAQSGNAEMQGTLAGLTLPGPQPRLLEADPVRIQATLRLDDPARPLDAKVSHKLFGLQAHALTAGKQSVTLALQLPSLAPLAAFGAPDLRGSASVDAVLDGYPEAPHADLKASVDLEPGQQLWSAALGRRAQLQASALYRNQSLTIDSLKIAGSAVSASAGGVIGQGNIQGRWNIDVSDLHAFAAILEGTIKASGSIDGAMTSLNAAATVNSTIAVRGSPSGKVSADVTVRGWPSAASGTLTAHGIFDEAPLQIDVALEHARESVRAVIRHADWRSAHAEGEGAVAVPGGQTQARIAVAVGDLSDFGHLLGTDLGGRLSGNILLRPERESRPAGESRPESRAAAALRNAAERSRLQFDVDVADLKLNKLAGTVHLSGDGFSEALDLKASAQIPSLKGAAASVFAAGTLNLEAGELSLATAQLNYRGQDVRLLAPARIDFANGLSVAVLKLGALKAEFDLQGQIAPALALSASLHGVGPPLVNAFAPDLMADGLIEGQLDVHGSLAAPEGEVRLAATGIRMADDLGLGLPAADLHITAQLQGNSADLDARLTAGPGSQLSAVGRIPIAFDGAVDLKVNGNLEIGLINPLLEARGLRATGQLQFDASVAGSVAEPQIGGTVNLSQATLRDYGRGISLSDIKGQVTGSEGALQIKTFTAAAAPGTLSLTGTVGILKPGIPVDLNITARNAQPIVSKLVTANLNADLHLGGQALERMDLSGTVRLNRTVIGIPNGLPPNVAVLDVRRRGKAVVTVQKPRILGLDVEVQAPQQILVQGRGVDAAMGGELHISGTTDAPVVSGGFDLQRGSFSLASTRLNFIAGRIAFDGTGLKNRIDPTLDFTAQTAISSDTTATMRITGYADAPVFDFSSNPVQPPDEIMALLLFGVPANQLSPLQLAQIGYALASLSGVGGGGFDPIAKIQKSLGLDRLAFGAATTTTTATGVENSGASIQAGRYIFKRVYIEARQNTTGTSQVQANVDLTKHLKLQTRLGNGTATVTGTTPENDPGSSIGLFYQFEY